MSLKNAKDRAVKAARLYQGSMGCRMRDQQKLYRAMMRACERLAEIAKIDLTNTYEQVVAEAGRQGAITPTPGKDV